MARLLFPAFAGAVVGSAILAVAACDPDLTPHVVPGRPATEGGTTDAPAPPPSGDGGPTSEGGGEGGTEAGVAHLIDGINDFAPGEKLATTSPLYDGYLSWDEANVYFGMSGKDVGDVSDKKWVLIYVDGNPGAGNPGSATGIGYNCSGACTSQQAHLPFSAGFHVRWKADGKYTDLQKWNPNAVPMAAWVDVGPISTVARQGTFMELSIARSAFGKPTKLKVHMNMVIEQTGVEWTYAGVPSTSFMPDQSAPPAFAKFYEFDLSDRAKAPNAYTPLP